MGKPTFYIKYAVEKAGRVLPSTIPIMAGGGILSKADVRAVVSAGAEYIELGLVSMLHPWRVKGLIAEAWRMDSERVGQTARQKMS